jgi:hypothetical protein
VFEQQRRWFASRSRSRCDWFKGQDERFRPGVELLEDRVTPAVFNVLSTADGSATAALTPLGGGVFDAPSLRAAIQGSNSTAGPNTINLTVPGTYQISIFSSATDNSGGEFAILNNSVTILNTSGSAVTIDGGGGNSRVFDIAPDSNTDNIDVVIGSLNQPSITIEHGNGNGGNGGGIQVGAGTGSPGNSSSLKLNNVIVTGNSTNGGAFDGGGIDLAGTGSLTLNSSTVSNNQALGNAGSSAVGNGGGIAADANGSGGTITINDSTITGNVATGDGGGIQVDSGRGGTTALMVMNSTVSNNTAAGSIGGGGISTEADNTISISDSLFAGNTATGYQGGGLNAHTGTSVTISDSEFTNNSANNSGADGGAIRVAGADVLTVENTTLDNNSAFGGAGIEYFSSATTSMVENTTIVNNVAGNDGGGIRAADGTLTLLNDTITGNTAGGFGVGGVYATDGAAVTVGNTIIAGNLLGPSATTTNGTDIGADSGGTFTSQGGNLIGNTSPVSFTAGTGDQLNGAGTFNPGPLANNGGPLIGAPGSQVTIPTIAELAGSTTIDRGLSNALTTDERGFARPDEMAGVPDIGAFELQDATLAVSVTPSSPSVVRGTGVSFLVTVADTSSTALPDDNSTVTVTLSPNLAVVSAPPGATVTGNTITFRLGAVAAHGSVSFLVVASANSLGTATASATVASPDAVVPLTPATAVVKVVLPPPPPVAPLPPLPQVFAFLVPAPSGQVGISGFVFDPDNLPEPHTVVIDWGDGRAPTTLVLPVTANLFGGGGTYSLFSPLTHRKHHHRTITVYVVDAQVVEQLPALGGIIPHANIPT